MPSSAGGAETGRRTNGTSLNPLALSRRRKRGGGNGGGGGNGSEAENHHERVSLRTCALPPRRARRPRSRGHLPTRLSRPGALGKRSFPRPQRLPAELADLLGRLGHQPIL